MKKSDENHNKIRIFISHAVANETIAHKLVDLLVSGVGVGTDHIFCSSLPGNSISTGKGFIEKIKSALIESDVVILILSSNYYESIFSIAELGGAWTLAKDPYPIVVSPLKKSDVGAVLLGRQAIKIDVEEDLDVMFDDLKKDLSITGNSTPTWTRKKKEFIEQIKSLLDKQPPPKKVDFVSHQKIVDELSEYKKSYSELEAELAAQVETNKKLASTKTSSEKRKILLENLPDQKKFEEHIKGYDKHYEALPKIVITVFYYFYSGKRYWPENWDSRIDDAHDEGYLNIDEDNKTVEPNLDDPKVKRLNIAIKRIKNFLESEAESDFFDLFEKENDFQPNLDNKRFWQNYLGL